MLTFLVFTIWMVLGCVVASGQNVWHQNQRIAEFQTEILNAKYARKHTEKFVETEFESDLREFIETFTTQEDELRYVIPEDRKSQKSNSESSDPLLSLLEGLKFQHKGVVTADDVFRYKPQHSAYTEPENVTIVDNTWRTPGGQLDYLYKVGPWGNLTVPPLGMRSAVALGGISTGSTELRADGTFHEWMIMNASPASAAKIAKLPELLFGIRTGKSTETEGNSEAYLLQTHPERELLGEIPGVKSIEYSGAHPVTKLKIVDDQLRVHVALYAYSAYNVGDMKASAVPAIAFTFVVNNPTGMEIDLSLMMNLPAREYQTTRVHLQGGKVAKPNATEKVQSAEKCQEFCVVQGTKCVTWVYDKKLSECNLYDVVTLNSYDANTQSGMHGDWIVEPVPGMQAGCLTYRTPGASGPSGNISSCPIQSEGVRISMATGNFLQDLWPKFRNNGHFESGNLSTSGLHGATAMQTSLPPYGTETFTFIMAWNYPHRDFITKTPGNQYSLFYPNTQSVASYMNANLINVVQNISALHSAFTTSSLEPFLQDIFINSLSHIRSAMWFGDGRWRQWEAHDCTNMDSVHNDGERHIPYIMFFPDSVRNKLTAWAKGQIPNSYANSGMIQEQLRCGCGTLEPGSEIDTPCGRVMSDVSSMFIVYVLELYKWANDKDTLTALWPNVKKAAQWHMNVSEKVGVPEHMVNTYDVLGQEQYELCAYNSAFHVLAMAAAKELALVMGDTDFAGKCEQSLETAQTAIDKLQWNETAGYYNSYSMFNATNPGAIMTDTFYSQVLAFSLDLGLLVKNESRLLSHMKQELVHNDSPLGMLVQTGRYPYPGPQQDNAIWLMGNPNWATINIHLKQDIPHAISVANKTLNWWREIVNDLWNIPAIAGGLGYGVEGQPWASSHYGYFMSSWHIIFALSGQKANLPNGTLVFDSLDPSDTWSYPVLLPGVVGTVSRSKTTVVELALQINIGQLSIGEHLSIQGVAFKGAYPIMMKTGDKVIIKT